MRQYLHENFLLSSSLAEKLYHSNAKDLPVFDYHNHLNPADLAVNRKFGNMVDAWVKFDPYKHRAMRICGVPESGITGTAFDEEKFLNWAGVVPKIIGNPLYMWTALELKRIFGVDEAFSAKNGAAVWEHCNQLLAKDGFGAVDILKKFGVETLCTSDDLLDNVSDHQKATNEQGINVFPSLRGDSMLNFEMPAMVDWFKKLKGQTQIAISKLEDFKQALIERLDTFHAAGCRLADHSLDGGFVFVKPDGAGTEELFQAWLSNGVLGFDEAIRLKNHILGFLGKEYAQRGWILQLHIGAHRYTSSRLRKKVGPAGGFATLGKACDVAGLCAFWDYLEQDDKLPKTVLFTLNPADNEMFATTTGSFAQDNVPGKIQFGPGWWYNDHFAGIKAQLEALSNYGLISQFIGMTTDSRSVFSFSRHEYFRRILCNQLAEWVKEGNLPHDVELLSEMVRNISYFNSNKWIFNK